MVNWVLIVPPPDPSSIARKDSETKRYNEIAVVLYVTTCLASALVISPRINNKARAWSDLKSGYLLAIP